MSAQLLAEELDLPFESDPEVLATLAVLQLTPLGLQLLPPRITADGSGPLLVDFGAGRMRYRRRGGHNEPLGRAVGVGKRDNLYVVDATAGLGKDSFVLADLGCTVRLLERSAPVYALLRDGLQRASHSDDSWLREVAARMQVERADSCQWLQTCAKLPDVVYLDPMFPARKKSARVKKDMWLFQHLLDSEGAEEALLQQALGASQWRVVVKRPARAPCLPGPKPHHTLEGKTVRFDVYNCAGSS